MITRSPPLGHHVDRVEHEVQQRPADHLAVGGEQRLRRDVDFDVDHLGFELRAERVADFLDEVADDKGLPLRIAMRGEIQEIVHGHVQGGEPCLDFGQNVQAAGIVRQPPSQQTHVQRDRHQVVSHLVGDVGRHLAQVGQAVLACQLAVFQFQFFGQPRHFGAQRFVRPLEPQRGGVPGGEHGFEVGVLVGQRERERRRQLAPSSSATFTSTSSAVTSVELWFACHRWAS